MAIPIDPAQVKDIITVSVPQIATPMNLCKQPVEGAKFIPLQIKYNTGIATAARLVDLAAGVTPSILSQAASLYVDATNCTYDQTILFPDSGYEVTVQAGNTSLFPVVSGVNLPKFYVIPANTNSNDYVNIFIMNIFVPEFGTQLFQKNLIYGLNAYGLNNVPLFTESYPSSLILGLTDFPQIINPFSFLHARLQGVQIDIDVTATVANSLHVISICEGVPTNPALMQFPFMAQNTRQLISLVKLTDLNWMTSGLAANSTNLWYINIDNVSDLSDLVVYVNCQMSQYSTP